MKRALLLLLALLISGLAGNFHQTAQAAWQAKVEPELLTQAAEGPVEFLVMLNEQADLSQASRLSDKAARGAAVVAELQETARRSQAPVLLELRRNCGRAPLILDSQPRLGARRPEDAASLSAASGYQAHLRQPLHSALFAS